MRSKMLLALAVLLAVIFFPSGCGNGPGTVNCPVCGTDTKATVGIIDVILVPEHNPTGEPGGPFNSFDISWADTPTHRFYVSDRIGLAVVVVDTINNIAVNAIGGDNSVTGAGFNASPCDPSIPPTFSALRTLTRFNCKQMPTFGSGNFGGFPGAQCCASRANGVNPLSSPDGLVVTADGKTLFAANATSAVIVFDLTCGGLPCSPTNPPPVIAAIPTGQSPDWNGPAVGVGPCITSASGRGFDDPTCGDLRADEMSYDEKSHTLLVANGDPGLPFITLIDMTNVVNHTGTPTQQHCLPVNPSAPYGPDNFPTCILGQIYYDGAPANNVNVAVDDQSAAGFPCPDPSTSAPSGVSGPGVGAGGKDVPCHHGPAAPAGIGGSAFNPNTGHFLVTNSNAFPFGATPDLTIGHVDEIDPRLGNPNGPVIINHFVVKNCMPSGVVQGPGKNFLVGCADHDGEAFPPNEYVIDGGTGKIIATIDKVGGVDETWFNPGDNRYYLAARDMPTGPVLGVIDAISNQWLQNVPTNANSHSVAVDFSNNHIFVPSQSGGPCGTQRGNGCILVYAQQ